MRIRRTIVFHNCYPRVIAFFRYAHNRQMRFAAAIYPRWFLDSRKSFEGHTWKCSSRFRPSISSIVKINNYNGRILHSTTSPEKIERLVLAHTSSSTMTNPTVKYIRNEDGHFVCPHCSIVEEKQNTMLYHIESKHEHKFRFECTRCDAGPKFLQRCTYLHHLATVHPENPHISETELNPYAGVQYSCPDCAHTTHTKANLLIHYARSHAKLWIPSFAKGAPCTCCNREFASSSAYLYHAVNCFKTVAPETQARAIMAIQ